MNDLSKKIHSDNVKKGFYDEHIDTIAVLKGCNVDERIINVVKRALKSEKLMLDVGELSEAQEAMRKNHYSEPLIDVSEMTNKEYEEWFEKNVKNSFEDEIADTIIRALDLCGFYGINIDSHIELKLKYNRLRPYMHGKKF